MSIEDRRAAIRPIILDHLNRGDALGWFDAVYRNADGNPQNIPWATAEAFPRFMQWLKTSPLKPGRALVVGSGLGDDAELLAARGWQVDAFDISAEAIAWTKRRFPNSRVRYHVADLFKGPPEWQRAFDLVVEVFTLQALPESIRAGAAQAIAQFAAGTLYITSNFRDESEPNNGPPWRLTRRELLAIESGGLTCRSFEEYLDGPVRRAEVVFARA